jgi:hypothetical protein
VVTGTEAGRGPCAEAEGIRVLARTHKTLRLTREQVSAALKRAGRRNITERTTAVLAALRSRQPGQPKDRG